MVLNVLSAVVGFIFLKYQDRPVLGSLLLAAYFIMLLSATLMSIYGYRNPKVIRLDDERTLLAQRARLRVKLAKSAQEHEELLLRCENLDAKIEQKSSSPFRGTIHT